SATPAVVVAPSGAHLQLGTSGTSAALPLTEQGFYEIPRDGGGRGATRVAALSAAPAAPELPPPGTALLAAAVAPRSTANGVRRADGSTTPAELERRQRTWWFLLLAALLVLGAETLLSNRLPRQAR